MGVIRGDALRRVAAWRWASICWSASTCSNDVGQSDAYLEGWAPGPETERPGDAETVARDVAAELEEGFQDLVTRRFFGPPR